MVIDTFHVCSVAQRSVGKEDVEQCPHDRYHPIILQDFRLYLYFDLEFMSWSSFKAT